MNKEPQMVNMKMRKVEIFNAGKEAFYHLVRAEETIDRLKVNLSSALNIVQLLMRHMPELHYVFEDDALPEPDKEPVKPKGERMEIQ